MWADGWTVDSITANSPRVPTIFWTRPPTYIVDIRLQICFGGLITLQVVNCYGCCVLWVLTEYPNELQRSCLWNVFIPGKASVVYLIFNVWYRFKHFFPFIRQSGPSNGLWVLQDVVADPRHSKDWIKPKPISLLSTCVKFRAIAWPLV